MMPFTIGTTSYIIPEPNDNLIANVRFLVGKVKRIQLLFFGKDYLAELMSADIIERLTEIRAASRMEYSVHLPIDYDLMNERTDVSRAADHIAHIVDVMKVVGVNDFILHVDRSENFKYPEVALTEANRRRIEAVLDAVDAAVDPKHVFIENVGFDLTYFAAAIAKRGHPICMDLGHLYRFGHSMDAFVDTFGSAIQEVHLHGIIDGKDHRAFPGDGAVDAARVMGFLRAYRGSVIIEVFNEIDLNDTLMYLNNPQLPDQCSSVKKNSRT
ncbi:MAG: cobamide remodeling phosphodiesterase CbiR [Spirochaetota bacterium]